MDDVAMERAAKSGERRGGASPEKGGADLGVRLEEYGSRRDQEQRSFSGKGMYEKQEIARCFSDYWLHSITFPITGA